MSIKRYEANGSSSVFEDANGSLVDYEDYSALEQKLTDMAVQLANAESKCRGLAGVVAENSALKKAAEFATTPDMWIEQADGMLDYRYCEWYVDVLKAAMETPATDACLAEVRAQGVDMFALMFAEEAIKSNNITTGWRAKASRAASEYAEALREDAAQLRKGAEL
ncbi:hypothetical protein BEH71_10275 [Citrobacter freundii]|uniref:hypothetical protein n=1 Tax=Citrobacter freundii TaxID=546 RepID=UPI0008FD51F7|nr:hypothetical protein [Citrobacter freundii]OIZ54274.1 hypothetical protein BEH71_10275 [Citrobacter freundii]